MTATLVELTLEAQAQNNRLGFVGALLELGVKQSEDALMAHVAGIEVRYAPSPTRIYHGWDHILSMRDWLSARIVAKASLRESFNVLRLAILYHDLVYDWHAKDNEEQSAALAEKELSALGLRRDLVDRVKRNIMHTKHKILPGDHDQEGKLMVMADLVGLTAPMEGCWKNTVAIWEESGRSPEFPEKNEGFLQMLADRDNLFCGLATGKQEHIARVHIAEILHRVSAGYLPKTEE